MALPLWGQLQKSMDDDQTIVEAIAELITAHEADPEAHLGEGESLEMHKKEDVIDHPAGSLLSDKQTMTEISATTIFESLDGWSTLGDVNISDIPGLRLQTESGIADLSLIGSTPQVPRNFRNSDKNMLFQTLLHFDDDLTTQDAYWGFISGSTITSEGFGFIVDGGTLYAYAKSASNVEKSSAFSADLTDDHLYRVYLDASLQQIFYYIDGILVATLDVPGSGFGDDGGPEFCFIRNSGLPVAMVVGILNFSRQI